MWNRHNVHKIFINIYRDPKTRKTLRLLSSGTKLFMTLELKVFRHEERETQCFYANCFYIVSSHKSTEEAFWKYSLKLVISCFFPSPHLVVMLAGRIESRPRVKWLLRRTEHSCALLASVATLPWQGCAQDSNVSSSWALCKTTYFNSVVLEHIYKRLVSWL